MHNFVVIITGPCARFKDGLANTKRAFRWSVDGFGDMSGAGNNRSGITHEYA